MPQGTQRALAAIVAMGLGCAVVTGLPFAPVATAAVAVPAAPAGAIRVGVGRSLSTADISATGTIQIIAEGAVQLTTTAGQVVKVDVVAGKIVVAGVAKQFTTPVRFVPVQPGPLPAFPGVPANPIVFKRGTVNRSYRGEVEVVITGAGLLSVVNVVNLEEYLLGVVPSEMPASWPIEAVKAQSVAARTYAMYQSTISQPFIGENFDVTDTTASQVYGGIGAEWPDSNKAILATRGQVVRTPGGALINAFFHSSSGGHTDNNEDVWTSGSPISWLRGVTDYDNQSDNRHYSWKYTISASTLSQAFGVGQVSSIAPTGKIGVSGRPVNWLVTGAAAAVTKTGASMRSLLGIPANPTQIVPRPQVLAPTSGTVSSNTVIAVVGKNGSVTERTVQGTTVIGSSRTQLIYGPNTLAKLQGITRQDDGVDVTGGGWGHGLGMSQWGAYGMAKDLNATYKQILTHYYQGTKVE